MIPDPLRALSLAMLQGAAMLAVAPLLKTTIKKMKARLQNRQGPPMLQGYYDLSKLLRRNRSVRDGVVVYTSGPRADFALPSPPRRCPRMGRGRAPLEAAVGGSLLVGTLALGRFAPGHAALEPRPFGGMGREPRHAIARVRSRP